MSRANVGIRDCAALTVDATDSRRTRRTSGEGPHTTPSFAVLDERAEPSQALTPRPLIHLRPVVQVLQGLGPEAVKPAPACLSASHEACFPQDLEVLRDGREGEVEVVDQVLDWALPLRQDLEDPPPVRIHDRFEDVLPGLEHPVQFNVVCA